MPQVKLDRDALLQMIMHTRSKVDLSIPENREVIDELDKIVNWLAYAQLAEQQSQFPRIRIGR